MATKISAEEYKKRMQKRKEIQEKRLAKMKGEKGLIIVHTGDGKGKTTAAIGMVIRSLGHGYKVAIIQFIKGAWEPAEKRFYNSGRDSWNFMPWGRDLPGKLKIGKGI